MQSRRPHLVIHTGGVNGEGSVLIDALDRILTQTAHDLIHVDEAGGNAGFRTVESAGADAGEDKVAAGQLCRCVVVVIEHVMPAASVDLAGQCAVIDEVEGIVATIAVEINIAGTVDGKDIVARTRAEDVGVQERQSIGAIGRRAGRGQSDRQISTESGEIKRILTRVAIGQIMAPACGEDKGIRTAVADQRIVAAVAGDDVITVVAGQRVIRGTADQVFHVADAVADARGSAGEQIDGHRRSVGTVIEGIHTGAAVERTIEGRTIRKDEVIALAAAVEDFESAQGREMGIHGVALPAGKVEASVQISTGEDICGVIPAHEAVKVVEAVEQASGAAIETVERALRSHGNLHSRGVARVGQYIGSQAAVHRAIEGIARGHEEGIHIRSANQMQEVIEGQGAGHGIGTAIGAGKHPVGNLIQTGQ